jgi:cysteine desulfurase
MEVWAGFRFRRSLASRRRSTQPEGVCYFDHNATAPLAPVARAAWLRAQDEAWQNPASPYRDAARVRLRLEAARKTLGELLGAEADRLVFVSGATEAAYGVAAHLRRTLAADARVAINPTEHPAVMAAFGEAFPGRLAMLPMDAAGRVEVPSLDRLLDGGDIGAAVVMAANNETGVLQPWAELARICRRSGVAYVCDATQWCGRLPVGGLGEADWVFASGHKLGGPKGVGFLQRAGNAEGFCVRGGGGQQRGHRGGTEDYPAVAALEAALREAETVHVPFEYERLRWRETFEEAITAAVRGATIVAREAERLWNTVSLILPAHENQRWVAKLDRRGFRVSTGSACASGREGPSHVLAALGLRPEAARRTVRVSAGWETTAADWAALTEAFAGAARDLEAEPAGVTTVRVAD